MTDTEVREVFYDALRRMYREIFSGEYNRLTLFAPSRENPLIIRPFVRYLPHGEGVKEAEKSRVGFKEGEGFGGQAWQNPGHHYATTIPAFQDPVQVEEFHKGDKLKLQTGTAANLSPYMRKVRTLYCFGFLDRDGERNGVLSIDMLEAVAVTTDEEGILPFEAITFTHWLIFLGVLFDTFRSSFKYQKREEGSA